MNSSKIVLIFCAFAISSIIAGDIEDVLGKSTKRCVEELGVDSTDLDKFNRGDLAEDEKWRCFPECVMKKNGLMKEDGTINMDNVTNVFPIDHLRNGEFVSHLQSCSEIVKGTNGCDIANKFDQCVKKEKALAAEIKDRMRTKIRKCEKETLMCSRACFMKGIGSMKEDGTINKDNFSKIIPAYHPKRDIIISQLQNCSEEAKGTNICEIATNFIDCMDENTASS